MEISSSLALIIAVGTQIISSLGLFWAVTSSFHKEIAEVKKEIGEVENRLSREITEMKVEQAKIEGRLSALEQTVRYILDCFPRPRIALQNPQEAQ